MKNHNRRFILTIILLLVASCAPFKPQERQSPEGELPHSFTLYTAESEPEVRWWEEFNDPDLNMLITEALSDNFTLKEAWSRLVQTRALAVQAGAALYPDLTGTAEAYYARQRSEDGSRNTISSEDYSLGVISSYELDLWGRIRAGRESGKPVG
jgi:outer membrane protein TolC